MLDDDSFRNPGLLVLPGWDDDGKEQFDQLSSTLSTTGWRCRRANLPDATWSTSERDSATRGQNLSQASHDYDALFGRSAKSASAILGFSYGGYIGATLLGQRTAQLLILRSPALYPDANWETPKAELDKRKLASYRSDVHTPGENCALDGCFKFVGHALLIDSEEDQIIPRETIESYQRALANASSLTRHTIKGADHQLSKEEWRVEYHELAVRWLLENSTMG